VLESQASSFIGCTFDNTFIMTDSRFSWCDAPIHILPASGLPNFNDVSDETDRLYSDHDAGKQDQHWKKLNKLYFIDFSSKRDPQQSRDVYKSARFARTDQSQSANHEESQLNLDVHNTTRSCWGYYTPPHKAVAR
jgi:hypothetical protein